MSKQKVRALSSVAVFVNGDMQMIRKGKLYDAGSPLVKGREDLFEDSGLVETATANPGEKRSVGRRPKPAPVPQPSPAAAGDTPEEVS